MADATVVHTFVAATPAVAAEVNANFQKLLDWANSGAAPYTTSGALHRDASKTVTALLSYSANFTPTDDKHITPKKYVDDSLAYTWSDWPSPPQLYQGGNRASTNNRSKYVQLGKIVIAYFDITSTVTYGGGLSDIEIRNLPVTAAATASITGVGHYFDTGATANRNQLTILGASTTSISFRGYLGNANWGSDGLLTENGPKINVGDALKGNIIYEAA